MRILYSSHAYSCKPKLWNNDDEMEFVNIVRIWHDISGLPHQLFAVVNILNNNDSNTWLNNRNIDCICLREIFTSRLTSHAGSRTDYWQGGRFFVLRLLINLMNAKRKLSPQNVNQYKKSSSAGVKSGVRSVIGSNVTAVGETRLSDFDWLDLANQS